MLNKIIHFSLNNRLFILLAAILLIVGGLYISQDMEVDVFPDLTAPTVVVMTDAQGMSAEEVERLVTFHIETAMNGATDVRRVRSTSAQGSSFVWVEFDWGADIYKTRQVVSEKLVTLGDVLPEGVIPVLAPQSSIMGEILFIGMQSDSTSQMELRTLAEWVVKPAILATGGVSQVTIIGMSISSDNPNDSSWLIVFSISIKSLELLQLSPFNLPTKKKQSPLYSSLPKSFSLYVPVFRSK
jgi:Cu/Ag efflux pump CusA